MNPFPPPNRLPLSPPRFWLPWGVLVLLLALLARLLWVMLFQGEIGGDAIRYLWISEHVRRGEWQLLPQLYSSPLLPLSVGLLSHLTGDLALAATWLGVILNTLAVGLAMVLVRQLVPAEPFLAWFTGAGLAVNHVWCRLAPFALTENLFYPLLLLFIWLLLRFRWQPTWRQGLGLGFCWGALFLSREIGLYYGAVGFVAWLASAWWEQRQLAPMTRLGRLAKRSFPVLSVLAGILAIWMYWYYLSFGIVSLGEGGRFYSTYTRQFDRQSEATYPGYAQGEFAFFRLRPYELMEYSRFPRPEDPRYPQGSAWRLFAEPAALAALLWDNLKWSLKEFQRVTSVGFLVLMIYFPFAWWRGRLALPPGVLWLYGISWGLLGLTFLGPLREARLIGWFFPWLYASLGVAVSWTWLNLPLRLPGTLALRLAQLVILGLVGASFFFPQYFKEVPRRWQVRQEPHVHQLAAEHILKNFGKNAIISSSEAEVAYRAGGYWIGQPNTDAQHLVEWLYLGKADFLLIREHQRSEEDRAIFWSAPQVVAQTFPELQLVAGFEGLKNATYGHKARLFRFTPNPEKMAAYRQIYPWAGTPPWDAGAAAATLK